MGMALPPPSLRKSGSAILSNRLLNPVVVCDTFTSMNSVPVNSSVLDQIVRPGEANDRPRHVKRHRRNRERAPGEVERSFELRGDTLGLLLRRVSTTSMAQLVDLALDIHIGESGLVNRKSSVEPELLDDICVTRSARANVNVPLRGVRPGSSLCHGPKVPFVAISPGGMALVSVASNGMGRSNATVCMRRSWIPHTFGFLFWSLANKEARRICRTFPAGPHSTSLPDGVSGYYTHRVDLWYH